MDKGVQIQNNVFERLLCFKEYEKIDNCKGNQENLMYFYSFYKGGK